MQILIGLVLLPSLIYIPGWLWSRLIVSHADLLDRHYERFLVSTLWTGWLALLLAELGIFSLLTLVGATMLMCLLAWLVSQRFSDGIWLVATPRPRWEIWVYLFMLLVFGGMVARPFEMVTGGRDAGVYVNTGYAIARTGSIVQHDALLAEIANNRLSPDPAIREPAKQAYTNLYGNQNPQRFIATRFTQPSFLSNETAALKGDVYPNNLHLYPSWIAVWTALFGLRGGLLATGYLGWLAIWSIAMLGRRLLAGKAGAYFGSFALVFVGLNTLQIWFSRYSTAEIYAQLTLWAGLAMWAKYATSDTNKHRARLQMWYGILTGVAIGQIMLSRLEFLTGVAPLMLYLFVQAIRRRWTRGETWIMLGLGSMLVHGVIHIATISWMYFGDNTWGKFQDYAIISRLVHPFYSPLLQDIRANNWKGGLIFNNTTRLWIEIALVVIALSIIFILWYKPHILQTVERIVLRYQRWLLAGLIMTLLGLSFFAYVIRPRHLTFNDVLHPIQNAATWESYIGAPLDIPVNAKGQVTQREIVLGNMVRLGWYFSPLGIVLAVLGLAHWLWRDLNRASWLILVTGIAYSAFPINDTYGTSEQVYIYIARRFIPGAVPMFSLGIAWAVTMLILARRTIWRGLGLVSALAMIVFFVATGWRSVRHVEYAGALNGISTLAAGFEPNAIVLMRGGDRDTPTNIATPLKYAFGVEALVAYSPNPLQYRDFLAAQVRHWQDQGRPVYLMLGSNGGALYLPNFSYEDHGIFNLQLAEWQQLQSQKPYTSSTIRFTYRIYKLLPPTAEPLLLQFGVNDYAHQVAGFYPVEQLADSTPYMWLREQATLILPSITTSTTLNMQFGLGTLPPSLANTPVNVCLRLESLAKPALPTQDLGCQPITTARLTTLTWQVPPLSTSEWLLQIVPQRTWIPNDYATELATPPNDSRIISVQWGGATMLKPTR